jgi:hypothetical protein
MTAYKGEHGETFMKGEGGNVFIFTTVARNYLSQAAVLFGSIKRHCEDITLRCFVVDGYDDEDDVPEVMRSHVFDCRNLGVADFEERAFKYSVTEFATSLKPDIFKYIFDLGNVKCAIFFDPDTKLYSNTDWVKEELRNKSILVTPHLLHHEPYDASYSGRSPYFNLSKFLFAGIYNTGFVAIKNDIYGRDFIHFWSGVLRDNCFHRFCYDQKWADFIPNFFGDRMGMVKDPGANVSYWNLHERALTRDTESSYSVNGSKLKFMHFSKIYNHASIGTSAEKGKNQLSRVGSQLLRNPEYRELYQTYIEELASAGFEKLRSTPYRYSRFEDGLQINVLHRRMYVKLMREGEVPNPFSVSGKLYSTLKSKNMLEADSYTGIPGSTVVERVLNRLLDSKRMFRLLYQMLGSKKYFALLHKLRSAGDLDGDLPGEFWAD